MFVVYAFSITLIICNLIEDPTATVDEVSGPDSYLWNTVRSSTSWNNVTSYMETCRININVRQVLKFNQNILKSEYKN